MDSSLPTISEMYTFERSNKDYGVVRKHVSTTKRDQIKKSPTKRGHYLDDAIRTSSSPGPANKSNAQKEWSPKNLHQSKYSDRKTYVDDVQHFQKKRAIPAANHYGIQMPWPKKTTELKNVGDKINFVDTCQYESLKTPGPGEYIVSQHLGVVGAGHSKRDKYEPHVPLKPIKPNTNAEMCTYNPCPVSYSTFQREEMFGKKSSGLKAQTKKQQKGGADKKQNKVGVPGPGYYQMINSWKGKDPLKKTELNYLNFVSRGPSQNVYYH